MLSLPKVGVFAKVLATIELKGTQPIFSATINQYPPVHYEGWMVSGHRTIICWVPVPWITMVVTSVAITFSTYLLTTHKQVLSR
jgi:hypothetical protein